MQTGIASGAIQLDDTTFGRGGSVGFIADNSGRTGMLCSGWHAAHERDQPVQRDSVARYVHDVHERLAGASVLGRKGSLGSGQRLACFVVGVGIGWPVAVARSQPWGKYSIKVMLNTISAGSSGPSNGLCAPLR
jgi:hypothetical protein